MNIINKAIYSITNYWLDFHLHGLLSKNVLSEGIPTNIWKIPQQYIQPMDENKITIPACILIL